VLLWIIHNSYLHKNQRIHSNVIKMSSTFSPSIAPPIGYGRHRWLQTVRKAQHKRAALVGKLLPPIKESNQNEELRKIPFPMVMDGKVSFPMSPESNGGYAGRFRRNGGYVNRFRQNVVVNRIGM
jgi:hypothetical protein